MLLLELQLKLPSEDQDCKLISKLKTRSEDQGLKHSFRLQGDLIKILPEEVESKQMLTESFQGIDLAIFLFLTLHQRYGKDL